MARKWKETEEKETEETHQTRGCCAPPDAEGARRCGHDRQAAARETSQRVVMHASSASAPGRPDSSTWSARKTGLRRLFRAVEADLQVRLPSVRLRLTPRIRYVQAAAATAWRIALHNRPSNPVNDDETFVPILIVAAVG